MTIKTAVIPVAGRGTRFLPVTKTVAKEMLPLVDTPILHHIVMEAVQSGIEKIVLVTSKGKASVENYFDDDSLDAPFKNIKFVSVRQTVPRGLGHAILTAQAAVGNEPFAVLLGDDIIDAQIPCTKQLIDIYEKMNHSPVVGVMEVAREDTSKYGIVGGKTAGTNLLELDRLVEKPNAADAPSTLAIPGRYILTPDIFSILENARPGVGGEIQLTDSLLMLAQKRKMYAYQFSGQRFDAGDRFGYIEANLHYALKRPELREKVQKLLKSLVK